MAQLVEIQSAQNRLEESFSKKMSELEAKLQSGGQGQAKDTVARVAEEFRTFRELMFDMLRLLRKQIADCTHMVDAMETRHRRKALLFLGVPETANETCTTVVLDTLNKTMMLKNISAASIATCHRIGSINQDRPRPILVRFIQVDHRSSVWRAKTILKGSSISVKEFLTKTRQLVFSKARQHFGLRGCWTQDGIIVVKANDGSRHKVTTIEDLNLLLTKFPKPVDASSSAARSECKTVVASTSGTNAKARKA